jgi:hypothetical protein
MESKILGLEVVKLPLELGRGRIELGELVVV